MSDTSPGIRQPSLSLEVLERSVPDLPDGKMICPDVGHGPGLWSVMSITWTRLEQPLRALVVGSYSSYPFLKCPGTYHDLLRARSGTRLQRCASLYRLSLGVRKTIKKLMTIVDDLGVV